MAKAQELTDEQKRAIIAYYEKFRHVRQWYDTHINEWRNHVLTAAKAAREVSDAFELMADRPDYFPPWVECEEDKDLYRQQGKPATPIADSTDGFEVVKKLSAAEGAKLERLTEIRDQTVALEGCVEATEQLAELMESSTQLLRLVVGAVVPGKPGRRAAPEVTLAFIIAEKTGIQLQAVQKVISLHTGEIKSPGKLASAVSDFRKSLVNDDKSKK